MNALPLHKEALQRGFLMGHARLSESLFWNCTQRIIIEFNRCQEGVLACEKSYLENFVCFVLFIC